MTATASPTSLTARADDYRFEVRCELLSHNVHAVSYGETECSCRQCLMLRPLPGLLAELADAVRCRTVLAAVQ